MVWCWALLLLGPGSKAQGGLCGDQPALLLLLCCAGTGSSSWLVGWCKGWLVVVDSLSVTLSCVGVTAAAAAVPCQECVAWLGGSGLLLLFAVAGSGSCCQTLVEHSARAELLSRVHVRVGWRVGCWGFGVVAVGVAQSTLCVGSCCGFCACCNRQQALATTELRLACLLGVKACADTERATCVCESVCVCLLCVCISTEKARRLGVCGCWWHLCKVLTAVCVSDRHPRTRPDGCVCLTVCLHWLCCVALFCLAQHWCCVVLCGGW